MFALEFLNNCYIYIAIYSKKLLANFFTVFFYNKGLNIEINNIAKAK